MINDKKGMSAVIIMVIMIGLALVVIAIAWVVIQGIVSEGTNTSAIKAKCLNTDLEFTNVAKGTNYVDNQIGDDVLAYNVFVMRKGSNTDEAGVKITFTSTVGVIVSPEVSEKILNGPLETTQFFNINTTEIKDASKIESVQATPYFVVEDTEEKIYCEDQQISKKISA